VNMPPGGSPPPPGQPPQWPPPPPGQPPYWPPPRSPPAHGPQYWPPQQGQPWRYPPTAPPPKSNRGLVIGLIAAVAVLGVLFGAVFGAKILRSGSGAGVVSESERMANAKTATFVADFDVVCGKGSVSNAAEFHKPYRIAAFFEGVRPDDWSQLSLDSKATYAAHEGALSSINVVACLSRKPGTEVKSGSCQFESGGDDVDVDRYAVQYEVELREAKTGKTIGNLGAVNGPADHCPFLAFFDRNHPKIFSDPDAAALEAKLGKFAAG
jgi:hypothetical protein